MDNCTHEDLDRGWDLHFRAERKAHILSQRIELLDTRIETLQVELKECQDMEGQSLAESRCLMQRLQASRKHISEVMHSIQVQARLTTSL